MGDGHIQRPRNLVSCGLAERCGKFVLQGCEARIDGRDLASDLLNPLRIGMAGI